LIAFIRQNRRKVSSHAQFKLWTVTITVSSNRNFFSGPGNGASVPIYRTKLLTASRFDCVISRFITCGIASTNSLLLVRHNLTVKECSDGTTDDNYRKAVLEFLIVVEISISIQLNCLSAYRNTMVTYTVSLASATNVADNNHCTDIMRHPHKICSSQIRNISNMMKITNS
jgi:hypothetical protein